MTRYFSYVSGPAVVHSISGDPVDEIFSSYYAAPTKGGIKTIKLDR